MLIMVSGADTLSVVLDVDKKCISSRLTVQLERFNHLVPHNYIVQNFVGENFVVNLAKRTPFTNILPCQIPDSLK